ncbi:MAG: hypothetical protein P8X90_02510 [Desulfobacterales bacterium]|jgi:hypothetical protein
MPNQFMAVRSETVLDSDAPAGQSVAGMGKNAEEGRQRGNTCRLIVLTVFIMI